ncbi:hypothetical protein PoB_005870900, partial [Plakobranchus ocellatus]
SPNLLAVCIDYSLQSPGQHCNMPSVRLLPLILLLSSFCPGTGTCHLNSSLSQGHF